MDIQLVIKFGNSAELELVAHALNAVESTLESGCLDVDAFVSETAEAPEPLAPTPVAEPTKKKGGRPRKAKPEEVKATDPAKGAEVLDQLKESVAATPEVPNNVVPLVKPPAQPAGTTAKPTEEALESLEKPIVTGQDLQEYILGLVHQKRIDPTTVKAKVYTKYGVIRSLDMTPDQVKLALVDVNELLKPAPTPAAAASDLDL